MRLKLTLARKVLLLAGIPILFVVLFIGAVSVLRTRVDEAARRTLHSAEVLERTEFLTRSLADAESATRAWMLTGDAAYSALYERAATDVPVAARRLEELVQDNPRQLTRAREVRALAQRRASLLSREADLMRQPGLSISRDDARRRMGLDDMIRLRSVIDLFVGEERRLSAARRDDLLRVRLRMRDLIIGSAILATVLLVSLGLTFARGVVVRLHRLTENARRFAASEPLLPSPDGDDEIARFETAFRNMTATLDERIRFAGFGSDVGAALTKSETLPEALRQCASAMVARLGASIASIWMLDPEGKFLELAASAGLADTIPGLESRIPIGKFRIGRIALDRLPRLVLLDREPPRDDDKNWARNHGMVSFVGYPMILGGRVSGVLAMFAKLPLTETALDALGSVADQIAVGIGRFQGMDELAGNEARTSAILKNMLGGLITTDAHAKIESVNPAAEKIFGFAASELVGAHLSRLIPFPEGADPRAFLRSALEKSLGQITEWDARRKNGEVFPMELALFPFETREGRRYAGNVHDISERREIDRLKKEFVSTVSHELRTPLTAIRGSLGLLGAGVLGELPGEALEVVAVAERNVIRLVNLINDILDLERLDQGHFEMRFERVSVSSVLDRALEAVRAFADHQGIALESSSSQAVLYADPDRVVQVLVNLISNAVKFSSRGSTVAISVLEQGGWTEFRVRDPGRGIPAALCGSIFERFRQVEASDAREKGGTGLGLAICRAIVEQHAGSIGAESEEGVGSLFWFRVPAARPSRGSTEGVLPSERSRRDVLLVEDDPAMIDVVVRQLGREGVSVRTAVSGAAALRAAHAAEPDLIVLDIGIPEGDGFFVVAELRKNPSTRETALLVYTGRDLSSQERDRLQLGSTCFLTKSRASDREFVSLALRMLASVRQEAASA